MISFLFLVVRDCLRDGHRRDLCPGSGEGGVVMPKVGDGMVWVSWLT